MTAGERGDAAVTIGLTWADAVAMSAGDLSPGEAIAAGRVAGPGGSLGPGRGPGRARCALPHLQKLRDLTEY